MYEKVLADFGAFLRDRRLVRSSSVKHYVRWVGDFLAFAAERRRQGLEGNLEEFLLRFPGRLENSGKHEPWQVGQAKNAVRIYYYQFRKGGGSRDGVGGNGAVSVSDATSRMRELLRLRHYSYRTEEVYLGWVQRFYGYVRSRPDAGGVESVTPTDVRDCMAHLALDRRVSASTQNAGITDAVKRSETALVCMAWFGFRVPVRCRCQRSGCRNRSRSASRRDPAFCLRPSSDSRPASASIEYEYDNGNRSAVASLTTKALSGQRPAHRRGAVPAGSPSCTAT